jgi:hypothetical protein
MRTTTIESWRIDSLIETFETIARDDRKAQSQLAHSPRMAAHFEGLAHAREQAARWLREAVTTSATTPPVAA